MKTISINTPDGKVLDLQAPDNATPDDIHQAIASAVSHYTQSNPQQSQNSFVDTSQAAAEASNPQEMLKTASPSNLGKLAGVAAINAPNLATVAINSLPGIGDPSKIPSALEGAASNAGELSKAIGRVAKVQGGGELTPKETVPARIGQGAGLALEMQGPNLGSGVKPTGAFTAGISDPSTALPGALEKAQEALGAAKSLARVGENPQEAAIFRQMLSKPQGIQKIGEAAIKTADNPDLLEKASVTRLLAMREASGKMQSLGGTFANDYKTAFDNITDTLKDKVPDLMKAMNKARVNYLAQEGSKFSLPTLTAAINPEMGIAKTVINAAKTAGIRNTAGAITNGLLRGVPSFSTILDIAKKQAETSGE